MIDFRHLRTGLTAAAALLLTLPFIPLQLDAQQAGGRYRVLVAPLQPEGDLDEDFGRDVSEELRELIDLPTHVAMEDDDIDDAADEYDLDWEELNCIQAQQLAAQISVELVFCGTYESAGGGNVTYDGRFVSMSDQSTFEVPQGQVNEDDRDAAARQIMDFFEMTTETLAQISYCGQDFSSQNWEGALEYCTRALELQPESTAARTALARTYLELERYEEALEHYQVLIENDPYNSSALESAGYAASLVGETELARDYYAQYLELNPENVQVRMRVAYDLAQAGDDLGAMTLLETGLEQAPENIDLHEQYGSMAARAALALQAERSGQQPEPSAGEAPQIDPEVADLFRRAVASLNTVIEARGEESLPQYVMNTMGAHMQLGEVDEAIALGERGTRYFPNNAQVRSTLANAYNRAGDLDQAIVTLEEALELDPDLPNAYARMGSWYLDARRIDDAGEAFQTAVERGEQPADALANNIFAYGYNELHQNGQYNEAVQAYQVARELDISDDLRSQINFFHGYARFQQAAAVEAPGTVESAQQALPLFQEALNYLNQGRAYGDSDPATQLDALIQNTTDFIARQESIIAANR